MLSQEELRADAESGASDTVIVAEQRMFDWVVADYERARLFERG